MSELNISSFTERQGFHIAKRKPKPRKITENYRAREIYLKMHCLFIYLFSPTALLALQILSIF